MACQEDLSSINAAEGKPTAMHQAQSRHELNHIVPHQVLWQMTCRMQQQESATSVTQISAHLPPRTLAHIFAHLPPRTPAGAVLPCSLHPRGSHAQTQQLWRAMKSIHNTVTNTVMARSVPATTLLQLSPNALVVNISRRVTRLLCCSLRHFSSSRTVLPLVRRSSGRRRENDAIKGR